MTTTSTVEDEVVEACVEYTAEQSRDVRRMVDLLRICGEIAEAEGDQKVQKKHFVNALEQLETDHYTTLLDGMAEMQRRLLITLAWPDICGHLTAPSTTQVYEQHQKIFEKTVPTYRRVAGILKEMEVMNLIGTRNVSKGRGGRNNEVWLKIPAQVILERTKAEWEPKWLDRFGKKLEEFEKRFPGFAASRVR